VDRDLAHLGRRGFTGKLTFKDDALDRIACKYICVLTGEYHAEETLEATIQFPWKEIFNVPLRKPG